MDSSPASVHEIGSRSNRRVIGSSPRGAKTAGQRLARRSQIPLAVLTVCQSCATRVSDLHFPVGGSRFRPCLEDVLDMVVRELGVDHQSDWRNALAVGRERWRRMQAAAVVRDASEAIRVLEQLGYDIRLRQGMSAPQDNRGRMREL